MSQRDSGVNDVHEGRQRVLIECPPHLSPGIIADVLERHGYSVQTCDGPSAGPCDLLDHGSCRLVDDADIVLNMLGSSRDTEREVLDRVHDELRPAGLVVEATRAEAERLRADMPEVTVVAKPTRTAPLVEALELAGRRVAHADRGGPGPDGRAAAGTES